MGGLYFMSRNNLKMLCGICGITYVTKTNKKREVFWYNRFEQQKTRKEPLSWQL